jgi:tRNA (mo5U34)-methyltransferase
VAPYESLTRRWRQSGWLVEVCDRAHSKLLNHSHGDLPRWKSILEKLPAAETCAELDHPAPMLGKPHGGKKVLREQLMGLHPWRKGPLRLAGIRVDTEWRSDLKWARVSPYINLHGQRVLDIGSGNGYFGLRMLGAGADFVIGIDPTLLFVMQYFACRHFSGDVGNYVLPLGVEELPEGPAGLDTVFSMGVLYHRKDPASHLGRIFSLLKDGGTLVLETLVLPKGEENNLLIPDGRYARMRNVWAIPGTGRLLGWIKDAGFSEPRLVDITPTTIQEQRSTAWMTFESLEQALDPSEPSKTVEGLPAPVRAIVIARR